MDLTEVKETFMLPEKNYELSQTEEIALAKLIKEGSVSAKQMLVKTHLKLVVSIAKKFAQTSKLPLPDLIQEGNVGLMTAVEKFNYKLGYRFATYAAWWIKQAMFKANSEQTHSMKMPVYIQETLSKFAKLKTEIEKNQNKPAQVEEVAKKMQIDVEKINTYLNAFSSPLSLDGSFDNGSGSDLCLADVIEDKNSSSTYNAEYNALSKDIATLLNSLKDREKSVITMRFGLFNEDKKTLEEIGKMFGVTKECIRQTEARALRKLKEEEMSDILFASYT